MFVGVYEDLTVDTPVMTGELVVTECVITSTRMVCSFKLLDDLIFHWKIS